MDWVQLGRVDDTVIQPDRKKERFYWSSDVGNQKGMDSAIQPGGAPVAWIILEWPQQYILLSLCCTVFNS